jgi:hypothetical protein
MQFTRRIVCLLPILVGSFLATLSPPSQRVLASSFSNGSGTGTGSGSATVLGDTVEAVVQFDSPATDGSNDCEWRAVLVVTNGARNSPGGINVIGADGVRRSQYARLCKNQMSGYYWIPDNRTSIAATSARSRLSKLVNMLATRTAPPMDKMVVNVGTWFWVPRAAWKPVSVTAYIPLEVGVISVTATVTPFALTYSPGDGHSPVTCKGPGEPWSTSLGDTARSSCMYTYRSASHTQPSRAYNNRMSVTWKVSWSSNLGIGGSLPNITVGLNSTARVFELQALAR